MVLLPTLALLPIQPASLQVVSVDRHAAFAGRLGDRVTQSIVARDADGRTVNLRVNRSHTWIKPVLTTFAPGDRILVWIPKGASHVRVTPDQIRRA